MELSFADHRDYTVARIFALLLELAAADSILDDSHYRTPEYAQSGYTLRKIAGHNVVISCLPSGIYGTNAAAGVVSRIQSIFPNIRYGLMVGIGGGVPSKIADIRLGDVVVSKLIGEFGGVKQYDLGKSIGEGHLRQAGMLSQPPVLAKEKALGILKAYSFITSHADDKFLSACIDLFILLQGTGFDGLKILLS